MPAAAQAPPPPSPSQDPREAQRTELYKQAVQMANAGRWADAAATLQAVLATDSEIGYLVTDLDQDVALDVKNAMAALETDIRTRILY